MATNPTTLPASCTSSRTRFHSGAMTVTTTGSTIVGTDNFTSATFFLNVTAASGTSPTLNVYIQKLLPDDTTWQDIASFTQRTAAAAEVVEFISGGNSVYAQGAGALAAGTTKTALLGSRIRYYAVVAGSTPSFTFTLDGEFYA